MTYREVGVAHAWAGVAVLMLLSTVSYMDRQILALLVEPVKADLGLTDTQIGLAQGLAFSIFYSLAGLPLGAAADRYSRRLILFGGVFLFSLASASCGLATSFHALFISRMLVGVGEAVITPVALSIIGDTFPKERLALAMGVFGTTAYVGQGGALIAGGMIYSAIAASPDLSVPGIGPVSAWQATFLLIGLPGLLLAFLAFGLADPRSGRAVTRTALTGLGYRVVFRGRRKILAYFLAGFAMLAMIPYVTIVWTPAFFARQHAWAPKDVGLAMGLIVCIVGMIGSVAFGRLLSSLVERGHRHAYFTVPGISCLLAAPIMCAAYLLDNAVLSLCLIALGYALMSSMGPASYTAMQLIVPAQMRARMAAIYVLTISIVAGAFAPLLVATLTDYVFTDPQRIGQAIALTIGALVPPACALLLAGRHELLRVMVRNEVDGFPSAT